MAQYKVLLVDDDVDILNVNKDYLASKGYEILVATTMEQAIERVQIHSFDCIVLDVMLPDGNAFEFTPKLQQYTKAPIIFLTALEDLDDRIAGFKAGADDYITKPFALEELHLRINAHIKRNLMSEGFLVEFPPLKINIKTREVTLKDEVVHLTNREFDILRLLSETPNVIVPFKRIFKHVWGENEECDNHLVMVNISYLRKKMEKIAPEITFVKTEWGIGYSFAYPPVKSSLLTDD
ncbi:MAG: response regulator transcription factor [Clostridia bacterium]|nr:response regulator transcription factor [Clostridia bacterium]